ncbi:hypothetical protein [Bradyrhizobium sp. SZCCHNR1039]|uniref:hypothetical protein n=1 Tax=Bradyrhizobium sp. SZCCHNR1039 TaxID=3057350 RepID=UPI002916A5B3|nr:hypothetical protein [Bradyrhizobium sp. SZCCHNR1039]
MSLEEYLAPDPNIRDHRPWSEILVDRTPSVSSRDITLHSAISVHGYTFIDGRMTWYESVLERCCALLARLRPDIVDVAEQPPAIAYIDDEGMRRHHTFDFRFTTTALGRVLTAVKPSALVAKTGIGRVVQLVAEQVSPSVADVVSLFTEEMLTEIDLFNSEAVNLATRDEWPEDDAAVAKVVSKLRGETTIGDLVERCGLGGYGYDAVVRAIDARKLRLIEYGKLEFDAIVAKPVKRKD